MHNNSQYKIIIQYISILGGGLEPLLPRFLRLCIVYQTCKLYEIMIHNTIAPTIELPLIKEHDGLETVSHSQAMLNITQYIQDGYQKSMITRTGFVDLAICCKRHRCY